MSENLSFTQKNNWIMENKVVHSDKSFADNATKNTLKYLQYNSAIHPKQPKI